MWSTDTAIRNELCWRTEIIIFRLMPGWRWIESSRCPCGGASWLPFLHYCIELRGVPESMLRRCELASILTTCRSHMCVSESRFEVRVRVTKTAPVTIPAATRKFIYLFSDKFIMNHILAAVCSLFIIEIYRIIHELWMKEIEAVRCIAQFEKVLLFTVGCSPLSVTIWGG